MKTFKPLSNKRDKDTTLDLDQARVCFCTSATLMYWVRHLLAMEGSAHYRMFNNILSMKHPEHPFPAASPNNWNMLRIFPDVPWETKLPPVENYWFKLSYIIAKRCKASQATSLTHIKKTKSLQGNKTTLQSHLKLK